MHRVKFFLFGSFHIETNGLFHRLEPHKAEELLVFLILHREQPHTRERLADILWREIHPEQSKRYFRKTLWQLQSAMEPICGKSLLDIHTEWIQFNRCFDCDLDIATFEKTFKGTQGIYGEDLEEDQARCIQDAIELFQNGLLEGWYQDWCLFERERLQYLHIAMLDKLMSYCESHGNYEKGLTFGERILQSDKAHERTHRWLMRLHYLAGDRTTAIRQYHKCTKVLEEELGVEPAENTRLLFEMICKDRLPDLDESHDNKVHHIEEKPLKDILDHLSNFNDDLSKIQTRLVRDIRIIQRTLKEHPP